MLPARSKPPILECLAALQRLGGAGEAVNADGEQHFVRRSVGMERVLPDLATSTQRAGQVRAIVLTSSD